MPGGNTACPESMTGYGRGEAQGEDSSARVEIKSVNHRFLEVVVRLPRPYLALEERVRQFLKNAVARGRLEVFCTIEDRGDKRRLVKLDKELAMVYYDSLRELAQIMEIPAEISLNHLAALPGVLGPGEDDPDVEGTWLVLREALNQALAALRLMRQEEGNRLTVSLLADCQALRIYLEELVQRAPQVVEEFRQKLANRLQEVLGPQAIPLDPARLALEVTLLGERAGIDEELVRLGSHLGQMEQGLQTAEPVGRRLDFLAQEMYREVNTIGSKANDRFIADRVVYMKSGVERIREQVQNLQ